METFLLKTSSESCCSGCLYVLYRTLLSSTKRIKCNTVRFKTDQSIRVPWLVFVARSNGRTLAHYPPDSMVSHVGPCWKGSIQVSVLLCPAVKRTSH